MHKAIKSALLPQYASSEEFMERFLEAIHDKNSSITRSSTTRGIKTVDESELKSDYLEYFTKNKSSIENEFFADLSSDIGEKKACLFCKIISKYWYDGRKKRNSRIVKGIKQNISDYLKAIIGRDDLSHIVKNHDVGSSRLFFTREDIASILTVNKENMYKHISLWLEERSNADNLSRNDVFFRRGLSCKVLFDENDTYKEWDFINSYSIAFSAPEKFSQMISGIPIILNADCDYFEGRILFFSPFIKGMDVGQLEVGVIPRETEDYLLYQGEHGGIHEYLLGHH